MRITCAAALLLMIFSFDGLAAQNRLTDQERADGWRLLFDGTTTDSWRGYRNAAMPPGWQVADGALTRVEAAGDIISVEQFESFELTLDWMIHEGGNSGIFFHVTEEGPAVWSTGPEFQILDDERHRDGLTPETSAGSNYALHAPVGAVVNPPGEWNSARLVVRGNHVEHWLNGKRIVSYELGNAEWEQLVAASKFRDMPGYGRAGRGHIALQDHGDFVAFRNIRIRVLRPDADPGASTPQ
jgi:hypothetical protein